MCSSYFVGVCCGSGNVTVSYEPPHDKTNKMARAPNEDSDQPGPSLISAFAAWRKLGSLATQMSAQRRLWSDWADAQADLSLRWAHSHFVGFVMRRLVWFCVTRPPSHLSQLMRLWYLSHGRPPKAQVSLRIRANTRAFAVRTHEVCKWTKDLNKIQTSSLIGWLHMRVWRMSLRKTTRTIISLGSFLVYYGLFAVISMLVLFYLALWSPPPAGERELVALLVAYLYVYALSSQILLLFLLVRSLLQIFSSLLSSIETSRETSDVRQRGRKMKWTSLSQLVGHQSTTFVSFSLFLTYKWLSAQILFTYGTNSKYSKIQFGKKKTYYIKRKVLGSFPLDSHLSITYFCPPTIFFLFFSLKHLCQVRSSYIDRTNDYWRAALKHHLNFPSGTLILPCYFKPID